MPEFREIRYEVGPAVATVTLNRPASLNALTPAMLDELSRALDLAVADERVGALVLTGEGRGFCSGADLLATKPPVNEQGQPDLGRVLNTSYNPLILKMRALPKPIIAAVNGIAAGAGASLALIADITVAARSAHFLQAFVNVGLVVDAGGTWILPRILGEQRAMALTLLGEKVPAEQAKAWGLVWEVVEDEKLMDFAQTLARRLAGGRPSRHRARQGGDSCGRRQHSRGPARVGMRAATAVRPHLGLHRRNGGLRRKAQAGVPGPLSAPAR